MPDNGEVQGSRVFRQPKSFAYLEDEDRFLSHRQKPDLNFGFIGCGLMGVEHMRNTLLEGRAGIGGIFDLSKRSIGQALSSIAKYTGENPPTVYSSLQEACADPATDALVISTPNFTHIDVMRVAGQYNKPIFLEKPIATSIADAYEICQLINNHNRIVRIGLQYRYKAIYAEAIAEIRQRGAVGEVQSINMMEHRFPFLDKVSQWNKFDKFTGGTLVEKCCHYFDLINLFAGAPAEQVFAVGNQAVNFKDFSYDNNVADGLDQAHVVINYPGGVIGAFSLSMIVPGATEELVICGNKGRLVAREQALLGEDNTNHLEIWSGENGASRVSTPSYPSYIANAGHHGATFFEHVHFVDEITSGVYQGPTSAEAFWSLMVGTAAQTSIVQSAAIDLVDLLPSNFAADTLM